ncbi:WXG100 family type VII secretion target [Nocardia sp. NBC_01377]|uniref:WXG100 family type VII secretion target n=1 Tax=Nocardia sp. NBC_01377 TaxID=2903595 RepID=UPI00325418E8
MSVVNNDDAIVRAAQSDMSNSVSSIKTIIGRVESSLESSRPGWEGDAAGACQKAVASWQGESARLNAILDELTALVGEGNTTYINTDSDNTGLVTSAGSGGGHTNL